jgi:hypothetical protein
VQKWHLVLEFTLIICKVTVLTPTELIVNVDKFKTHFLNCYLKELFLHFESGVYINLCKSGRRRYKKTQIRRTKMKEKLTKKDELMREAVLLCYCSHLN